MKATLELNINELITLEKAMSARLRREEKHFNKYSVIYPENATFLSRRLLYNSLLLAKIQKALLNLKGDMNEQETNAGIS